mmetsp:Transcript_116769/g.341876  ORF Transcript_116769/g.341876 Transcript_116769/m.341876 type:complete len:277 (+) Transcript_116769:283-1113(+)
MAMTRRVVQRPVLRSSAHRILSSASPEQHVQHHSMAGSRRGVRRGEAAVVDRIMPGTTVQQSLHCDGMAESGGLVERSAATAIGGIGGRTAPQQQLHHGRVAVARGVVEGGAPPSVPGLQGHPAIQQLLHGIHLATACGVVVWQLTVTVGSVCPRLVLEQHRCHLGVAVACSKVEGRGAVEGGHHDVRQRYLNELLCHLRVAVHSSCVQRHVAFVVVRLHAGPLLQQHPYNFSMPAACCMVERSPVTVVLGFEIKAEVQQLLNLRRVTHVGRNGQP